MAAAAQANGTTMSKGNGFVDSPLHETAGGGTMSPAAGVPSFAMPLESKTQQQNFLLNDEKKENPYYKDVAIIRYNKRVAQESGSPPPHQEDHLLGLD
jgi:hypothetical protein